MPPPLDQPRLSKTSPDAAAEHPAAASGIVRYRLPYSDVLREFATLLGVQLAREHLAEARKITTPKDPDR